MPRRLLSLFVAVVLVMITVPAPSRAAGETPDPLAESIQRAAAWLAQVQQVDGSWGARSALRLRDTATVFEAMRYAGQPVPGEAPAMDWVGQAAPGNTDGAARQLGALPAGATAPAVTAALLAAQNGDGGWGIAPGYSSNAVDTALSLTALIRRALAAPGDPAVTQTAQHAIGALAALQDPDGSWGVYPGGSGAVFVTASAVLALQEAATSGLGLTAPSTSVVAGARWLLTQRNPDLTWGAPANPGLTALAYRAALLGAPVNQVGDIPAWLLSQQQADGSWSGDPYATAQAIHALALAMQIPEARLGAVRLLKQTPAGPVESTSFAAYEVALLDAAAPGPDFSLEAMVEGAGPFTPSDGGQPAYNTGATAPGAYQAVVLLRHTATGLVLDERALPFTVEPTLGIRSTAVVVAPARTPVGAPVTPEVAADLVNGSNILGTVQVAVAVTNAAGQTVAASTTEVYLAPGVDPLVPPLLAFTPDVTAAQTYTVSLAVTAGGKTLASAANRFQVTPPPPPTRVDITKAVSPTRLLPGEGDVAIAMQLLGRGDPGTPNRQPMDLALTIDVSPSMTWGDIDWVEATPSRLDAAKVAAKSFVDMLDATDRGALISFSWWTTVVQGLTYDKALLKSRIDNGLYVGSGTAIGAGMQASRSHLTRYGLAANRKVMLLLSDGGETLWSRNSVLGEATNCKNAGITIFTIGLGATADRALLSEIAQRTGGEFFFSPTIADLQQIMDELGRVIVKPAGSDVRVTDTIPGTDIAVDAASISPAPYAVTRSGGNTVIEWRFNNITVDQTVNLGANLHLTNLLPGETREVNHGVVMTYVDQSAQLVRQELGSYTVDVAEALITAALTVDKPEYGPNEPVAITAQLHNDGAAPSAFRAVIEIVDSAGKVVATVLDAPQSLAGAGALELQASWNTGVTLDGAYKARLRLLTESMTAGGAEAPFAIRPDGAPGLRSATDKAVYRPGEAVQISHRVTNGSTNHPETGLTVTTAIAAPDGTEVWSTTTQVPDLMPGAFAPLNLSWPAAGAAPGVYTLHAVLKRGAGAVAEQTLSFEIEATAATGAGLIGSVTVTPTLTLPSGDISLAYRVTNGGNSAVEGATLQFMIADPEVGTAVATLSAPLTVAAGATAEGALNWSFDDLAQRPHLVAMSAVLAGGTTVPLATSGFGAVTPFTLTAAVGPDDSHRILVWGGLGPAVANVTAALKNLGYSHKVVFEAREFQAELRSGLYTAVVLPGSWPGGAGGSSGTSGGGLDHLDWELREKVYGGTGVILFGDAKLPLLADETNGAGNWLGVKADGYLNLKSGTANLAESGVTGAQSIAVSGKMARAGQVYGTAIGTIAGTSYPAAVTNQYGHGKTLWTAFDAGTIAQADVETLLRRALPVISMPDPTLKALGPAAVEVVVRGGVLATNARVQVTLPEGAVYLDAPDAVVSGRTAEYRFALAPGEYRFFRLLFRLPAQQGTVTVHLSGAYLAHDAYHEHTAVDASAVVTEGAGAPIAPVAEALAAFPADQTTALRATLNDLQANPPATQQALDQAIARLLLDIRSLGSLSGPPDVVHQAYDRLLGYYQARWAQGR